MSTPSLPFDPVAEATRHWREHGWGEAAVGMEAVTSLMRAQAIVQARVDEVLRPLQLTFARYELLMLLSFTRTGALPMAKAGARLQVHPASVTNAASRLEAAELVRRRPHPEDGRGVLVEITPAGRALAAEAPAALGRLREVAMTGGNVFAELMDAVRVCSLGQISEAFFEVGGRYRRSV